MRLLPLLTLLVACTPDGPADSKEEPLPPLAPPFIGAVAAAAPGTFRTDCLMRIELHESGAEEVVGSSQTLAVGGEWTGVALPAKEVLYKAYLVWDTCTTGPDGTGDMESSSFSGTDGDLFLFRYTGVTAAFDVLTQREDFDGGIATVSFAEGTTEDDVAAMADTYGVTATNTSGTEYELTWDDAKSVGEVLTSFSGERTYSTGSPSWIRQPDWW